MWGIWDRVVPRPRPIALVRTFTASVAGASPERKWSSCHRYGEVLQRSGGLLGAGPSSAEMMRAHRFGDLAHPQARGPLASHPSAMMEVMRPGHPWETNELDELRARQRQQLRAVPRRLLADLNVVNPVIRHDEDRGLVEMEFRRRARHWAEKDPAKKTLERLEALLPAVVLAAMVSATQIDEEVLGPDLGVLAKEKTDDEGIVTDAGAQAALRAFGAWAAMADQVAGDYSDPRLRASAPRADR
jgi:hypothetical protein